MLDFKRYLESCGLAYSTVVGYTTCVKVMRSYFDMRSIAFDKVDSVMMQSFFFERSINSVASRRIYMSAYRAYLRYAGKIGESRMHIVLHRDYKDVSFIAADEARLLCNRAPEQWMRNMIAIAFSTGLRISEICDLRISDLNAAENILKVRSSKGKSSRYIEYSPKVISYLESHLGILSVCPFSARVASSILNRYIQSMFPEYHVHMLRHSFAYYYLKSNHSIVDLSRVLGHTSIASTAYYINCFTK